MLWEPGLPRPFDLMWRQHRRRTSQEGSREQWTPLHRDPVRPKTHSAHPAPTFGNWPLSLSGQEVGMTTRSLFHLMRPGWALGAAAPPPGVWRGCPECTGPKCSLRPALVYSALTCCRVSCSLAFSSPITNPSLVSWEPLTGRHPGGESCMPSEKEEKLVGQGSSMEYLRPLCSSRNTQPCLPWPFSSSVCVFVSDVRKEF